MDGDQRKAVPPPAVKETVSDKLPPLPAGAKITQPTVTQKDQWAGMLPAGTRVATPAAKTALGSFLQPLSELSSETEKEFVEGGREFYEGAANTLKGPTLVDRGLGAMEAIGGLFGEAFSPITGGIKALATRPLERATGVQGSGEKLGDWASFATQLALTGKPGTKTAAKAAKDVGDSKLGEGVKNALSPTSAMKHVTTKIKAVLPNGKEVVTEMPAAQAAEFVIRKGAAQLAQAKVVAQKDFEQFYKAVGALPKGEVKITDEGVVEATPDSQLALTDAIETGNTEHLPPELKKAADAMRTTLDTWRDKVQSLGKGHLEKVIENYFPHRWKVGFKKALPDADLLTSEKASIMTKKNLKGPANFLKRRTVGSTLEGVARGLEPVSHNPLDTALLKINELQKFYHGTKMIESMKDSGMVKFARKFADAPQGWVPLEGREFSVLAPPAEEGGIGPQLVGKYYAPKPVAKILSNYMGAGLRGNGLFDAFRAGGNALNMAQLAWPGFHAIFASMDATVSETARVIESLAAGDFKQAAKSAAKVAIPLVSVPLNSALTAVKGNKLRAAYLDEAHAPDMVKPVLQMLKEGGGRIQMDDFYHASGSGSFVKSLKNGTFIKDIFGEFKEHPYTAFPRLLGRTLETLSQPIMTELVPRMKLGVFYGLAEDFVKRNPNASTLERQAAAVKIWDSVDNRLGQMVYDNVFWNKVGKDLAFMSVRSVGWNLGTIRELGGAAVDSARAAHELMTGKNPVLSHRMAYAFALPMTVGMQGAMLNYLFTGEAPKELKDYFFPRTGGTTPTGADERLIIPSYVKDVFEYNVKPGETLLNKAHPIFEIMNEMHKGTDYYGALIADPQGSDTEYLTDWIKYFGGAVEPFSFRSFRRLQNEQQDSSGSAIPPWISALGLNPAPQYITNPETEEYWEQKAEQTARRKKAKEDARGGQ